MERFLTINLIPTWKLGRVNVVGIHTSLYQVGEALTPHNYELRMRVTMNFVGSKLTKGIFVRRSEQV